MIARATFAFLLALIAMASGYWVAARDYRKAIRELKRERTLWKCENARLRRVIDSHSAWLRRSSSCKHLTEGERYMLAKSFDDIFDRCEIEGFDGGVSVESNGPGAAQ